jgi:tetratricopeptide (TPR) repeat protein
VNRLLLVLLVFCSAAFATPESLFEEGVDAFRQGNLEEAVKSWQSAFEQNYESGALYYNLGNAHFRLGHTAEAILFYERAARFLPRDKDVTTNLSLARLAVVDRVNAPVRLGIWDAVDALRDFFSLYELRLLFVWLGFASALFVIARILFFGRLHRLIPIVVIALWLLSGALFVWRAVLDAQPYAIITADKVDAKSAPDKDSKDVFALHEGLKVCVKANLAGWYNIELADGRQGWIPVAEAEQI